MSIEKQVIFQFTFSGSEELADRLKQEARKADAESVEAYIVSLLTKTLSPASSKPKKRRVRKVKAATASIDGTVNSPTSADLKISKPMPTEQKPKKTLPTETKASIPVQTQLKPTRKRRDIVA